MKLFLQIIFSLMVWLLAFAWMALLVVAGCLCRAFHTHPFRRFLQKLFGFCAYFTLSDIQVIYHPQFDPERISVFCQNHVSILDAFVASIALPHSICGIMHSWQFNIPFYGWLMHLTSSIPVKKNADNSAVIPKLMKNRAAREIAVLTFPEGTRTRDGAVHTFRTGIFRASAAANLPVVPLAVHGLFKVNRAGSFLFKPGKITILVGPQFETTNLKSTEDIQKLSKEVEEFIRGFVSLPDPQIYLQKDGV